MPGPNRWNKRAAVTETALLTGIKQGAAQSVVRAFGEGEKRKKQPQQPKKHKQPKAKRGNGRPTNNLHWDAFHESHLALPRAVAPYTVIRTTAIWSEGINDRNRLLLFGPQLSTANGPGWRAEEWSNIYCTGATMPLSNLRGVTGGVRNYAFATMEDDAWRASSITPAAFSIQIMNPQALQTTSGIVYIGRCKNKVNLSDGDLSSSFTDLAQQLVSYSNPRLCAAGKLALRGVQIDAVPNNMSQLSKFTSLHAGPDNTTTLGSNYDLCNDGFNPIFVYNPDGIELQILVCCEWRVRFDPSNPAYSACRNHKPATDNHWWKNIQAATQVGNGVIDIADKVATIGQAAGRLGSML